MEIFWQIIQLSIGGITIGTIVIFLGKFILDKSSEILLENHRSKLDLLKTEHQIKFSRLHHERAIIIKQLYQKLYQLEKTLAHLTSFIQGTEWKNDNSREQNAIKILQETKELLELNRIYFPESLIHQILSSLEHFDEVIDQMMEAKNKAKMESGRFRFPKGEGPQDLWKKAHFKVKNEIKEARLSVGDNFRSLIEV
ncbi:hypothetical protein [Salegentibacter sp. F14]